MLTAVSRLLLLLRVRGGRRQRRRFRRQRKWRSPECHRGRQTRRPPDRPTARSTWDVVGAAFGGPEKRDETPIKSLPLPLCFPIWVKGRPLQRVVKCGGRERRGHRLVDPRARARAVKTRIQERSYLSFDTAGLGFGLTSQKIRQFDLLCTVNPG